MVRDNNGSPISCAEKYNPQRKNEVKLKLLIKKTNRDWPAKNFCREERLHSYILFFKNNPFESAMEAWHMTFFHDLTEL